MASLVEWLTQRWDGDHPLDTDLDEIIPLSPTRLQVYAALISIGGRPGGGYGIVTNRGLYGRTGLHQDEAFEYWQLSAFVNGWLTGTDGTESVEVRALIQTEWDRVKALGPRSDGVVVSLDEARNRLSRD